MTRYCRNCGYSNIDQAKYCARCGALLEQVLPHPAVRSFENDAGVNSKPHRIPNIALIAGALALTVALAIVVGIVVGKGNDASSDANVSLPPEVTSNLGMPSNVSVDDERNWLDSYTWSELSSISAEIAAAPTYEEGLEIARSYHLVQNDGTLGEGQTKVVPLANGLTAEVQIVGFRHDERSDGSGAAGITFMFCEAIAERGMYEDVSDDVVWQFSDLRAWLLDDGMELLPRELADVVVRVNKTSRYCYGTREPFNQVTGDLLYVPAFSEIATTNGLDPTNDRYDDLYERGVEEGAQFQRFVESDVVCFEDNAALNLISFVDGTNCMAGQPCSWLLRSINYGGSYSGYEPYVVSKGGQLPLLVMNNRTTDGVVPFFSI